MQAGTALDGCPAAILEQLKLGMTHAPGCNLDLLTAPPTRANGATAVPIADGDPETSASDSEKPLSAEQWENAEQLLSDAEQQLEKQGKEAQKFSGKLQDKKKRPNVQGIYDELPLRSSYINNRAWGTGREKGREGESGGMLFVAVCLHIYIYISIYTYIYTHTCVCVRMKRAGMSHQSIV